MYTIGVSGSRQFNYKRVVTGVLSGLIFKILSKQPDNTQLRLCHGGAGGVDKWAKEVGKQFKVVPHVIRPDYVKHAQNPRYAPIARNGEIVDCSDIMLFFWDCESRGTADAILKCCESGKFGLIYTDAHNLPIETRELHKAVQVLGKKPSAARLGRMVEHLQELSEPRPGLTEEDAVLLLASIGVNYGGGE